MGVWRPCPQWGPWTNPLVEGLGALPQKVSILFFTENMLFCHAFKNEITIFAFIAYGHSI